jgi:hypothetical protein
MQDSIPEQTNGRERSRLAAASHVIWRGSAGRRSQSSGRAFAARKEPAVAIEPARQSLVAAVL